MPYQSLPPLIIIVGAMTIMGGLLGTIERIKNGVWVSHVLIFVFPVRQLIADAVMCAAAERNRPDRVRRSSGTDEGR